MKAIHIFSRGEEPISKLGEEPKLKSTGHMIAECKGKPVLYTAIKDGKLPDGRIAKRCDYCGAFTYYEGGSKK